MSRRLIALAGPARRGPALALLGALAAGALAACTSPVTPARNTLRNPRALALLCRGADGLQPIAGCDAAANVRAYVSGGSIGSIAIADPALERWVDSDPAVPGYSPKMVGDLPQALAADPLDGDRLYLALGLLPRIGLLRPSDLALDFVDLTFVPAGLVAVAGAGGAVTLWLADPEGGAVWRLPAAALAIGGGDGAQAERVEIGGSPLALAAAPDGRLVVGHLDHDHVTVLDPAGAVLARVGLGPACGDGLDNDGDGRTDRDDAGCAEAEDDEEGDPAAAPCADGVDDDGDGLTDFPADPGCSGWGGGGEALDQPACADGVDNDGDGLTDHPADPDCASVSAEGERPPAAPGVVGACNDGVDNDGDGLTDHPADPDCRHPTHGGELRGACADGRDNDGDGLTDLDDPACFNRASPTEVGADAAPVASVAVRFDGRYAVVGHRARRALYLLDLQSLALVLPDAASSQPFERPSRLDVGAGLRGMALPAAPLALEPVRLAEAQAMAVSLSMGGLVFLRFAAPAEGSGQGAAGSDDGPLSVGLVPSASQGLASAARPALLVDGVGVDVGDIAPARYASPGLLAQVEAGDGRTRWYGLLPSLAVNDHRSELWRLIWQGQLPGGARASGRLLRSDLLVDAEADFCRIGVVPGDLLLLQRGAGAPACGGLQGETLRYRVAEVGVDRLRLRPEGGAVDVPVTLANQLGAAEAEVPAPLPPLGCLPDGGLRYELRADGFLVLGSRSGLRSSRARQGAACAPWSETDPLQAARAPLPQLADASAPLATCPLSEEELAARFVTPPYGGGAGTALRPFANAAFEVQMRPGCAPAEVPGEAPRLLPPLRDATWRWSFGAGFAARTSPVGSAAVGLRSGPKLGSLFVAEQGAGTLIVVDVDSGAITQVLD